MQTRLPASAEGHAEGSDTVAFSIKASNKIIVWKLDGLSPLRGSVRYRCLFPLFGLADKGWSSLVLGPGQTLRDFSRIHAVIIVKSLAEEDLTLAQQCRQNGIPVYFDLCDNIFVDGYGGRAQQRLLHIFNSLTVLVSGVVTTGPEMVALLQSRYPSLQLFQVVDQLETATLTRQALASENWRQDPWRLRQASSDLLMRVRPLLRKLKPRAIVDACAAQVGWFLEDQIFNRRMPGSTQRKRRLPRLIWFGNHGSDYGRYGMVTLVDIASALSEAFKINPFELLIVSDSRTAYQKMIKPFPFPTKFTYWHPIRIFNDLKHSDICIIPNSKDAFSITKSANRAVMALGCGVPVAADLTPALEPLKDCIHTGDLAEGITRYLTDPEARGADLASATKVIQEYFSADAVAQSWEQILLPPP